MCSKDGLHGSEGLLYVVVLKSWHFSHHSAPILSCAVHWQSWRNCAVVALDVTLPRLWIDVLGRVVPDMVAATDRKLSHVSVTHEVLYLAQALRVLRGDLRSEGRSGRGFREAVGVVTVERVDD